MSDYHNLMIFLKKWL